MFTVVVIAVLFGPPLLQFALWTTRFCWVPGFLLLVLAGVVYATIKPPEHGELGSIDALGNVSQAICAIFLALYGLAMLFFGILGGLAAAKRREQLASPPAPLPTATVIAEKRD